MIIAYQHNNCRCATKSLLSEAVERGHCDCLDPETGPKKKEEDRETERKGRNQSYIREDRARADSVSS